MGENSSAFDYFRLLFDNTFLQMIVEQTNLYAETEFITKGSSEKSRISSWKPLTIDELLCFMGLLFHMGTIKCVKLSDYWKTHRLFSLCFGQYMGRDRFMSILRYLHFSPPTENIPDDRLYKIRSVVNYFNEKMNTIYYPGKNLSLDESMVLWRGRLLFRQYIKNKRHKYGVKFYILAEPDGLPLKIAIYTGQLDELGGSGHTQKVVMHLMKEKLNVGHSLFMDNFYNSINLAEVLLQNNTYSTGTLRKDRKDLPREVTSASLKKGETTAKYNNGIMVGAWKDKRTVHYISTEFKNEMTEICNIRGIIKEKPSPITKYNSFMSGIDRFDQLMSYYPCSRKTMRWYKKIGIHIWQMILYNSYYLHKKYSKNKNLNFYDYRMEIIETLLPPKDQQPPRISKPDNNHMLVRIEEKDERGRTLRKRCRCCSRNKQRTLTLYHCVMCPGKPGLCVEKCFVNFHQV